MVQALYKPRCPRLDSEVEKKASGSGPVTSRKLTEDERQKYFGQEYKPPMDSLGKEIKKPVDIRNNFGSEEQKRRAKERYQEKEEESMPKESKYPHITKEFLEVEFASGKSASQIEREQGMPLGSIGYHLKKHGVTNPNSIKYSPVKKEELKDETTSQKKVVSIQAYNAALAEIDNLKMEIKNLQRTHSTEKDAKLERLTANISMLKNSVEGYVRDIARRDKEIEDQKSEIERLKMKSTESVSFTGKAIDQAIPEMTLTQYQKLASRTANSDWDLISVRLIRNPKLLPLLNFALGAGGEAGEIADDVKKIIFHGHELDKDKLMKEIGDTLWYLSQLTKTLGYDFETVAKRNIEKLKTRYPEGFSEEASQERVDAG